jgi:hypothetical protein
VQLAINHPRLGTARAMAETFYFVLEGCAERSQGLRLVIAVTANQI